MMVGLEVTHILQTRWFAFSQRTLRHLVPGKESFGNCVHLKGFNNFSPVLDPPVTSDSSCLAIDRRILVRSSLRRRMSSGRLQRTTATVLAARPTCLLRITPLTRQLSLEFWCSRDWVFANRKNRCLLLLRLRNGRGECCPFAWRAAALRRRSGIRFRVRQVVCCWLITLPSLGQPPGVSVRNLLGLQPPVACACFARYGLGTQPAWPGIGQISFWPCTMRPLKQVRIDLGPTFFFFKLAN